jgi:hypothetical protein
MASTPEVLIWGFLLIGFVPLWFAFMAWSFRDSAVTRQKTESRQSDPQAALPAPLHVPTEGVSGRTEQTFDRTAA